MRLFVALELEEAGRTRVAGWRDALLESAGAELRPVPVEALHVTLVFLGRRPVRDVEPIQAAVAAAAEGRPAPMLEPRGVSGVPRRSPRLWALDLEDVGGRAGAVQRAVAEVLGTRERRAFWPHLTLARAHGRAGVAPEIPVYPPHPPLPAGFRTPRVVLYRSHLSPAGARYEALGALRLG